MACRRLRENPIDAESRAGTSMTFRGPGRLWYYDYTIMAWVFVMRFLLDLKKCPWQIYKVFIALEQHPV